MNLARAFVAVSGLTALSRVLGFVRDMLFAAALGAGISADAFLVAFKLPNFFRRLFAEGAFNAAFIPMFAGSLEGEGKAEAKRLADETMAVLLLALVVLVVVFEIAMPWVMLGLAPGFTDEPEKFALAIDLTRITFPYLLLISLVALFGGMLNSTGRFAAYAAAPILLNLSLIAAALVAYYADGIGAGHALAWGVTLGGVAQLLLLLANLSRAGLMPRLLWPRLTKGVRQVLRLFGPAALGAGVVQINLVIDLWVASFLPTGSISYLYYADRVNQLLLGVVGIAVGTALLPLLSRQIEAGDQNGANDSQSRAVELVMVFCVPGAVALTIIAGPIIAVLFERGAFDAADTAASAAALVAFAIGLPAYVLIKVFAPGFFARKDTKTPVKVAVVGLVSNLAIMAALIWSLGHVGIALATAGAAWINGGILCYILIKRGHFNPDERLKQRLPRVLFASALMALALWAAYWAATRFVPDGSLFQALALGGMVVLGLAVYAIAGQLLGAFNFAEFKDMMRRRSPQKTAD